MLTAPCIQCLPCQLESFAFEVAPEKLCPVLVRVKQLCFAQLTKCESTVPAQMLLTFEMDGIICLPLLHESIKRAF